MVKLAVIHYQPLEVYPPVMNFLNMADDMPQADCLVLTTQNKAGLADFATVSGRCRIKRYPLPEEGQWKITRLWSYLVFNCSAFFTLLRYRPDNILYFDTVSSFPVFLYRMLLGAGTGVFIHYHEYVTPGEYRSGMAMVRLFHSFEQRLYPKASWISQTNAARLERFRTDEGLTTHRGLKVMPNYPSQGWAGSARANRQTPPRRFVYVGAVSRETMYFDEVTDWIRQHDLPLELDVYSHNISAADTAWLNGLGQRIRFRGTLEYFKLPEVLKAYDIGLILYKGHIPNYVINAPNKLFEYLACGLSVWYPVSMEGCNAYAQDGSLPAVQPVDFGVPSALDAILSLHSALRGNSVQAYTAEAVYPVILQEIFAVNP